MIAKAHEEVDIFSVKSTGHQPLRKVVSDVTSEINNLGKILESSNTVELQETTLILVQAECECCGLEEECTKQYFSSIRNSFSGKWVCGLCSEAVKEGSNRGPLAIEEALNNHIDFVQEFNGKNRLNPKLSLTWAMRDIAKRSSENRRKSLGTMNLVRSSSCVPKIDLNSKLQFN